MCGICGQLMLDGSRPAEVQRLQRMLATMVHRGPDDEGTFCEGPVGIGIRRLSIIDVAGGHQPIFSEDRSKAVVCNGEIYNYVELRDDLIARGHRFATAGDTEVIVHLYEEKGADCVEDLNGMFGFALWDTEKRRLLLARDRVGIKPLHYAVAGGMLLFASEINALLVNPEIDRTLDAEAIDDYFTYFYIPGARSVYRSIRRVPPAHTVVWADGRPTPRRYWNLTYRRPGRGRGLDHYADAYREQLKRSVRLQLRSDVPLGVFLSGGLDSGSLVAAICEVTNRPPATFTVGFDNPSYDESPYARATARRYGTTHHEFRITPDDMRRSGDLIGHFGEPFGPFTTVQAYMLSKYSRDRVTVALAGDGGDELFGGYQTYVATHLAPYYLRLPRWLRVRLMRHITRRLPVSDRLLSLDFMIREFLRGVEMFARAGNLAWKVIFSDAEKNRLLTDSFRRDCGRRDAFDDVQAVRALAADATRLQQAMHLDLSMFLPDSVLTQTDRMSMAVSQEVRVPILDHEMVEFSATVPDQFKIHLGRTKILIRHALTDWLPPQVAGKRKTGFTTPIPIWIRNELAEYVGDILSPAAVRRTGILRPDYVQQLLAEHNSGRADHARRIWAAVHFMLWHNNCLRK